MTTLLAASGSFNWPDAFATVGVMIALALMLRWY